MIRDDLSTQRLLQAVPYLVDDTVGIIRRVEEVPREAGAPRFFHFYAEACNTGAFSQQSNFATSGGASERREIAMAKAIGEAIERYCSALFQVDELPLTSFSAAPFLCTPPDDFALYTRQQHASPGFPYVPFEKTTPVRWTPAADPLAHETWYVPAAMVFIPYFYDSECGERPIVQPISTGLACHCNRAEAALSAICEVIERDAFTIAWQARLGMPHIRIETLSEHNQDLVMRFEQTGSSVTLLNLTMDHGIPTIQAVLRSSASDAPALVFAAASALDPETAMRKSLEELAHTRRLAHKLRLNRPPLGPTPTYDNITDHLNHVHFYCDQTNAKLADFVLSSSHRIEFEQISNLSTGDPQRDLEILVKRVCALGHKVLVADITTPDVGELGLTVVRAIIPGFHPLFMGHRLRALAGSRLWEVPQKLGYEGISSEAGDNPIPHPYP